MTKQAAQVYWKATGCTADPVHCCVLASKLYENDCWDLEDLEEEESCAFELSEYIEAEKEIFKAMDYCLLLSPEMADNTGGQGKASSKGRPVKKKK